MRTEGITRARVEQDGLGPAFARAEHVAIRKAAASSKTREAFERNATREQLGHVHVHRLEAGAVEAGRHLHLAVHALLAQDSHTRARARVHVGRCNVFFGVVRQVLEQTRVFGIGQCRKRFIGAGRVVAPALNLVAGSGPRLMQRSPLFVEQHGGALAYDEAVARRAYGRHGSAKHLHQRA